MVQIGISTFEYDTNDIVSEWLYEKRFGEKEHELFVRSRDMIDVSPTRFPEGKGKGDSTNLNRLFLSLVAQLKGEKANSVIGWFRACNVLSGIGGGGCGDLALGMFLEHQDEAMEYFKALQLGFTNLSVRKVDIPQKAFGNAPGYMKTWSGKIQEEGNIYECTTTHNVYGENGLVVGERNLRVERAESAGTRKVMEMSGPIIDALNTGKTLIVDGLDAKLHPLLTRNIALLFMDPERNRHGAQLVFSTHDTNLLDLGMVRRDQIWFAQKDDVESTDIYSLAEFKDGEGKRVRDDRDIRHDYIRGRYGAVPFIGK